MRSNVCLFAAVATLAATTCALAGETPLTTELVVNGLTRPVFVTAAPGDDTRLFVLEKQGRIRILNRKSGELQTIAEAFLDIDVLVGGGTSDSDERGLLGLAFHPEYQKNGHFYINYTNTSSDTVVARYTRADADSADPGSALIVLTIDQPFINHNGGWMGFGPNDDYLYIATGDGGSSCDPAQRAQDITEQLLGKILRIDVNGELPYAIPAGNPFVDEVGDDEIWAYGLRNPWRPSFDRSTGDLFIADVGQFNWEEINFQPFDSAGGENYGWDCMEGTSCAPGCPLGACTCGDDALVDPIHEYSHGSGCSITGGYIYRGCAIPDLSGTYFFADYCSANVWSFELSGSKVIGFQNRTVELDPPGILSLNSISSFGEDSRGEIYIVEQAGGEIFKIVPLKYSVPLADVDCDLVVGFTDLLTLLSFWGPCDGCPSDLDGDGSVGFSDVLTLLSTWGPVIP